MSRWGLACLCWQVATHINTTEDENLHTGCRGASERLFNPPAHIEGTWAQCAGIPGEQHISAGVHSQHADSVREGPANSKDK